MAVRRALVVCLLAAAAGCGAVPFADPGPTPPETVTSVSLTPTPAGPATPSLPPGVTDDGALQVDRLQRAHNATLAATNYTLVFSREITLSNGDTVTRRPVRRVAVGETAVLATDGDADGSVDRALYLNGSEGYERSVSGNRTTVTPVDPAAESPASLGTRALRWYLSDIEFASAPVERDGTRLYRLYSPAGQAPSTVRTDPQVTTSVWNYTATAYVTPEGFVRTMVVDYELSSEQLRGSVSLRVEYTAVGATTVSRPEWVPNGTSTPTTSSGPTQTPTPS